MRKRNLLLLLLLLILLAAAVWIALSLFGDTEENVQMSEPESAAVSEKEPETMQRMYSEKITDIFKHCTRVIERDEGYYPVHFSDARLENYQSFPVMPYAGCSAGITMEFSTDEPTISFTYENIRTIWDSKFDIIENGELTETIEIGNNKWGYVEYTRRVTDGPSDLVICLPTASETAISDLHLGNFKTDVTGDRTKLLVLGDSISQGLFGSSPSRNWPFLLAQKQGLDYLNLSVGGETFRSGALDPDIGYAPDYIIVALGTNDLFQTRYINVIERDIADYLERLNKIYPETPVTLITPFGFLGMNAASNMFNSDQVEAVYEVICRQAERFGYSVIDGRELFPGTKEYYALNDSVHLSSLGFEAVADSLDRILQIR